MISRNPILLYITGGTILLTYPDVVMPFIVIYLGRIAWQYFR
jgi:hypothetical protein